MQFQNQNSSEKSISTVLGKAAAYSGLLLLTVIIGASTEAYGQRNSNGPDKKPDPPKQEKPEKLPKLDLSLPREKPSEPIRIGPAIRPNEGGGTDFLIEIHIPLGGDGDDE